MRDDYYRLSRGYWHDLPPRSDWERGPIMSTRQKLKEEMRFAGMPHRAIQAIELFIDHVLSEHIETHHAATTEKPEAEPEEKQEAEANEEHENPEGAI